MSTGCQKDRKTVLKTDRQTDRETDGQIDRQTDFSAELSKQKLFRMSTGCQKVSQTDRTICSAPGRQSDRETE